jgi:hypothetical protein
MSKGAYLADLVTIIGTQDLVFVKLTVKSFFIVHFNFLLYYMYICLNFFIL